MAGKATVRTWATLTEDSIYLSAIVTSGHYTCEEYRVSRGPDANVPQRTPLVLSTPPPAPRGRGSGRCCDA